MNDALLVRGFEGMSNLARERHCFVNRQRVPIGVFTLPGPVATMPVAVSPSVFTV